MAMGDMKIRSILWMLLLFGCFVIVSAERRLVKLQLPSFNVTTTTTTTTQKNEHSFLTQAVNFLWLSDGSGYQHVWPKMEFGWQIVLGSFIGFCGAAFGSVGGIGGGGIFVSMISLVIGFDPKSSTAISKCMVMGVSVATAYYNLKMKHPTLNMPIIDYDLALLIQPMLMLGISIGVICNVIFPNWLVTILLIVLFLGISTKAFFRGVETWNKETIMKKEAARREESLGSGAETEYKPLPTGPNGATEKEVTIIENVDWKKFGLLAFVWVSFIAIQIAKIPISVGVTAYEATALSTGKTTLASIGDQGKEYTVIQLFIYSAIALLAGILGGLLGLGGGFMLAPLFLEMEVPPQVSSATTTFIMTFSASMCVVEYYMLKRFPIPYALYFLLVSFIAALVGQHFLSKILKLFGRASIIIFILASIIFISAILVELAFQIW
ncbi:sulfite exporter TauE/SafE family protein 3-like isoform X2 [Trifolium pratense]|uniref:sulfite exporter TauE/SafE family protein 3-like isoform X2 n=1 Tax=Trifolium pratense TaxID=57577 RepID=UPI001E69124D|nr:sulfite exporter TauE/SafE family protein 3-like isoform X2 [Trifolium pratense]